MQLDDTALKTVVAKAIFDGITPEQRQTLLTNAINSLLTAPTVDRYGAKNPASPLQEIFSIEVRYIARDLVQAEFKTNEALKATVAGIVTKTIAALSTNDEVANQMAALIARALERANRE
jgi:hypothetical protein